MTIDQECPIDVIERALELASRLEVQPVPLDFDPGDVRWRQTVAVVADRFSNYTDLAAELDGVLTQAYCELGADCRFWEANPDGNPIADCSERRIAEYRLREAALAAAEKACQRWLARKLLHGAAQQNG